MLANQPPPHIVKNDDTTVTGKQTDFKINDKTTLRSVNVFKKKVDTIKMVDLYDYTFYTITHFIRLHILFDYTFYTTTHFIRLHLLYGYTFIFIRLFYKTKPWKQNNKVSVKVTNTRLPFTSHSKLSIVTPIYLRRRSAAGINYFIPLSCCWQPCWACSFDSWHRIQYVTKIYICIFKMSILPIYGLCCYFVFEYR